MKANYIVNCMAKYNVDFINSFHLYSNFEVLILQIRKPRQRKIIFLKVRLPLSGRTKIQNLRVHLKSLYSEALSYNLIFPNLYVLPPNATEVNIYLCL